MFCVSSATKFKSKRLNFKRIFDSYTASWELLNCPSPVCNRVGRDFADLSGKLGPVKLSISGKGLQKTLLLVTGFYANAGAIHDKRGDKP